MAITFHAVPVELSMVTFYHVDRTGELQEGSTMSYIFQVSLVRTLSPVHRSIIRKYCKSYTQKDYRVTVLDMLRQE